MTRKLSALILMLALLPGLLPAETPSDFIDELNFYNTDLHLVLKALSEKTGHTFVEDVPVQGKVTIHISKRAPVTEVLDQMLRGLNMSWHVDRGVYHIGIKLPPKGAPLAKGLIADTYTLEAVTAAEAAEAVRPMLSEYGKVTVDYGLNSMTVTEISEIQEAVKAFLANLDVPGRHPAQINIQIKVLQIDHTKTNATKASLSWNQRNASEGLASNFNDTLNNAEGWGQTYDGWYLSSTWENWKQFDEYYAYYPRGLTFKVGNWGIDEILMRSLALAGTNRLNLLSEPDITVLDGQEARILIGEKMPLKTSGGGFQYYETGIILKVTPKAGEEGKIEISLNPQITERTTEKLNNTSFLNTREVKTTVEVISGGTVRIGGLLFTQDSSQQYKIPVLGDIPLLGMLFKSSETESVKKELVLLVSPKLVEKVPPRCATTAGISALRANLIIGATDVMLDWAEDVPFDNVGVVRYHVYRDVMPIVATEGLTPLSREVRGDATSWADLSPKRRGVTYYYAITAVDGAGNEQAVSNSPSITIPRR